MKQSGYFGPAEAPLFGTLHSEGDTQPDWGAVLCAPLGQEMTNSYRTQQALATALAARGVPCLQFDYAGCGNSADRPEDATLGALSGWQASLDTAIDHLRAATGVAHVVVIAMRAGALLAAPVAAGRPDVKAFVAVAPVIAGRTLLREWRALAATAVLKDERTDGALEAAGAAYSAQTLDALGALELAQLSWPAARPVLLIDRADLPSGQRWRQRLQNDGVPITHTLHEGIGDMLAEPHCQVVPAALVARVADWLHGLSGTASALQRCASTQGPQTRQAQAAHAVVAQGVRESVLRINAEGTLLFGVLSEPEQAGPRGAVLLLPNTGAVHHVGGHRLYVMLARRLAAQGHRVIRFDLSGLGESPARPGEPPDVVYGRRAVDDLAAAVAAARMKWPDTVPMVLGLCAGAYHGLRLAVREAAVSQCFVVNPLIYHWHDGMSLEAHEPLMQSAYYRAKWRDLESWRRLLSGKSDMRMLKRVVGARLIKALQDALARARGDTPTAAAPDDLNRDLLSAATQGARMQFIFSAGEPGWTALQAQGARVLTQLQRNGQLRVHHLDRADHTLTTASARERFIDLVTQLLSPERGTTGSPSRVEPVASRADAPRALEH
jgi:alpha-beta hydrolase superfamily lysophospholipase